MPNTFCFLKLVVFIVIMTKWAHHIAIMNFYLLYIFIVIILVVHLPCQYLNLWRLLEKKSLHCMLLLVLTEFQNNVLENLPLWSSYNKHISSMIFIEQLSSTTVCDRIQYCVDWEAWHIPSDSTGKNTLIRFSYSTFITISRFHWKLSLVPFLCISLGHLFPIILLFTQSKNFEISDFYPSDVLFSSQLICNLCF